MARSAFLRPPPGPVEKAIPFALLADGHGDWPMTAARTRSSGVAENAPNMPARSGEVAAEAVFACMTIAGTLASPKPRESERARPVRGQSVRWRQAFPFILRR